jgi:hypothetical protein
VTGESSTIAGMPYSIKVEYAHERKIRERNKIIYRVAHWPIWIWVFFIAPGLLTFDLFDRGPSGRNGIWLAFVMVATGIAGLFGKLPGVEPRPYILHFCEDKPNPLYRRVCYTFAWNALINFAALNLIGLITAVVTRTWRLKQIYMYGYLPLFLVILVAGLFGFLPRAGASTKEEGIDRRRFYGTVWAVTIAQTLLLILWKTMPRTRAADLSLLIAFLLILLGIGAASALGMLPRTRPILPGETIVAD